VRCVVEHGPATRLESRWASADANPYYALAGCLGAGADGLERELELPPMVSGDPHADASLERLPTTLGAAVANLERSDFARQLFGDAFLDTYLVMLRREVSLYDRQVTEWERARYLEAM
jgi:glutamine synthetase